jgi:hypothetical protein
MVIVMIMEGDNGDSAIMEGDNGDSDDIAWW